MFQSPSIQSKRTPTARVALLIWVGFAPALAAQDVIEFMSGAKIKGSVSKIDKAGKQVTFESRLGTRTSTRTYKYSQIHAVTYRGKRYIITPKASSPNASDPSSKPAERVERTRDEVLALINSVGSTPPDWLDKTPLRVPPQVDLSWPNVPDYKTWNHKYPGHYVWDVINPNPSRWREGIKLMYHIIAVNKNNRHVQIKAMNQLGTLYAGMLEDWPRAAYWWHRAGKGISSYTGRGGFRAGYETGLARCYWKLGNRQMAIDRMNHNPNPSPYVWCELGEHDRALQRAEQLLGKGDKGALLTCGDVCRHAGWYDRAQNYYQQAAALPKNNKKHQRIVVMALDRISAIRAEQAIDLSRLRNGTYTGRAIGYSGTIDVSVSVASNHIKSVKVIKHAEKQYYSSLTDIPDQIVQKQSVRGVDATSGATITAEAIVRATSRALAK